MKWPFGLYARETVEHLKSEVEFWRMAWKHERQRAEYATDRLLTTRGVHGISGSLMPDVIPPSPGERLIQENLNDAEFLGVGDDR